MNKLSGVEAARGIAALLVVLVHATSMLSDKKYFGEMALNGLFKFGHAGVDFFFVLSGFIIYFIHSDELGIRKFFASYWYKRFIRIFPIYWIVLFGYGVILFFSPTKGLWERDIVVAVSSFFLIPNIHGSILGVAWTLSHEILFYLIFSVMFINKLVGKSLLLVWLILIIYNIFTKTFTDYLWGDLILRIFNVGFFFGMAVAYLGSRGEAMAPRVFFIAGISLFFGAGIFESWGPAVPVEWPPLHLAYATGSAAALYGLVGLERLGHLKVPSLLFTLGKASYSIYLIHVIVIMLLQQLLIRVMPIYTAPPTLVFLAVVLITVAISVEFSKRIEQPLLKRLRPIGTQRSKHPVASE